MSGPTFDDRKLSFGAAADDYGRYRPTYPPAALNWLMDGATRPVRHVADVGAGTGAMTKVLLELGYETTAVEPDEGMRAALLRALPQVNAVPGTGEATGLARHSVDAVTVAQAFHWFDREAAAAEFRRIVRPGGVVGLIWNHRDDTTDWVSGLGPIIDDPTRQTDGDETLPPIETLFSNVERREFPHVVTMSAEDVLGLVATFSYVRLHAERDAMLAAVREHLATHRDTRGRDYVDVPYVTEVNRARLE